MNDLSSLTLLPRENCVRRSRRVSRTAYQGAGLVAPNIRSRKAAILCGTIFAIAFTSTLLGLASSSLAGTVSGAGLNNYKQITAPSTITSSDVSLIAGREFSMALQHNGTVSGWGNNGEGRSQAPAGLTGVVEVSAGIYHTLALKSDGTVVGWGFNGNDILSVPANLKEVVAVAAGGYHSLALKRDGTVVGWGFDGNGRINPPAGLRDVIAIDAGRDHSVALKTDGTVIAWGLNDEGQTDVPPGLKNVIAISAGENHTLALKDDGTVVAWGRNDEGQCTIPAGLTGVVEIAAGGAHSLALRSDGTVQAWGDNTQGQLNLAGSDIRGIAAGGYHSLVVRGNGPLITSQPRSQTTVSGNTVTFKATATGAGLTYQWMFNGQDIAGATGATLTVNNPGRSNIGNYSVRITNADGSVVSQNSLLIVRGRLKPGAPRMGSNGNFQLSFSNEFGDPITAANLDRYNVEVSEDMKTWRPLGRPCSISAGNLQVDDGTAGQTPRRFYRVTEN